MALKVSIFTLEDEKGVESGPFYAVLLEDGGTEVDFISLHNMARGEGLKVIENEYEWSDSWLVEDHTWHKE